MTYEKSTVSDTISSPFNSDSESDILRLKKILVPIDFSSRSKKALLYGVHFATRFNASLVLLHVLTGPADTDTEYEDEWKVRLRAWASEFVPDRIPVQVKASRGPKVVEIVNEAKDLAIDLMVISTHGRSGRAHALAGSLAERIVQLAPCPVLVIHQHEHDFIGTPECDGSKCVGADI